MEASGQQDRQSADRGHPPRAGSLRRALKRIAPPGVIAVCAAIEARDNDLTAEERRAVGQAPAPRRHEFAAGRRLARQALARLGARPETLPRDAGGRPSWPPGFVGSITHAGTYCAVLAGRASDWAGLGVDLERIGRLSEPAARRIMTDREWAWAASRPETRRPLRHTFFFSAKEAVFKCLCNATDGRTNWNDLEVLPSKRDFFVRWNGPDGAAAAAVASLRGRWACSGDMLLAAAWLPARNPACQVHRNPYTGDSQQEDGR